MNRSTKDGHRSLSRRQMLGLLGAGASFGVAGCSAGSGNVHYQEREDVDLATTTDTNTSNASAASAAAARAQLESDSYAIELDALELRGREMVVRDDYRGAVVQGSVENTGHESANLIEVRARVYNSDGDQLGRYLDSTDDVAAGSTWEFEIIVLESPSDIASYDIAVLGSLG